MRHGKKVNHLGRKAAHRKALLKNMSCSLIQHKRIKTTLAKAKALRTYLEPLITKGRNNTVHNQRVVFSYLQDKEAIKELFGDIATKIGDRPGGYLRIIKLNFRRSDGAEMALIEFVDYNETYSAPKSGETGKSNKRKRRTRRSGATTTATTSTVGEELEEELEEMEVALEDDLEEAIENEEEGAEKEEK